MGQGMIKIRHLLMRCGGWGGGAMGIYIYLEFYKFKYNSHLLNNKYKYMKKFIQILLRHLFGGHCDENQVNQNPICYSDGADMSDGSVGGDRKMVQSHSNGDW